MQYKSTRRLFILNALRIGALLVVPLPAHAAGNDETLVQEDMLEPGGGNGLDAGASANPADNVADKEADEEDENAAAGGVSQPEYKYVSIRRF